jgi:hypothetical protein
MSTGDWARARSLYGTGERLADAVQNSRSVSLCYRCGYYDLIGRLSPLLWRFEVMLSFDSLPRPLRTRSERAQSEIPAAMKSTVLAVLVLLTPCFLQAQTITSFEGIDASQLTHQQLDFDPNGAVGTKQYMEWVNLYYQAYDKTTFAPVWAAPQAGNLPWQISLMPNCYNLSGDGLVVFDRIASRWIIAAHGMPGGGQYYYCVAISNTDDLTSSTLSWYTYEFPLTPMLGKNSLGHVYFPDWPKWGTWPNGYYVSFDLLDADNKYTPIGVVACALDRTNMLTGSTPNPMQCFSDPSPIPTSASLYLKHSLIPANLDGVNPPPAGRDEFMVSIQNPPNDGNSTTSNSINVWTFHVDWSKPGGSTFTNSSLSVTVYTPGCYNAAFPLRTVCVPEPSTNPTNGYHYDVDSVGDRLMPRLSYRNFGTYETWLVSHTILVGTETKQTGIRWYELRSHGSGTPTVFQSGTIHPDNTNFRFMPSIAQDHSGNAAVGYSVSSSTVHPEIKVSWWNLPKKTKPAELLIQSGTGDQRNSSLWGDYTSMTVDPVNGCTFWYVNEYFAQNQAGSSINWNTRVANFKIPTCH